MTGVKVVVLGGSGVATPGLAEALVHSQDRSQPIDLVLVGRTAAKLEKVAAVAQIMAGADPLLAITHTTDVEAALDGADYVINQIRVGGLEARAFDESYPLALGLPGEETVGPGGFANASRTIPVALEYAKLVERVCPQATMLSFANPASVVQYAVTAYTSVNAVGLCDGPISLINTIAAALDAPADGPADELSVDYVGMHHFGWVTGVWRRGEDILGEVLDRAAEVAKDVDPAIVRAIGAVPGSYLNYVFHPDRMVERKRGKRPRAEELLDLQDEILEDFDNAIAEGRPPQALARRKAAWYRAIIAPVLLALVEGTCGNPAYQRRQAILNVVNQRAIPWLPEDAVVEIPTVIDQGRLRPLVPGAVPVDVQVMIQRNCTYEMLAVKAIVERDRALALRALLLNPIVHTYDQAAAVLERAWAGPGCSG